MGMLTGGKPWASILFNTMQYISIYIEFISAALKLPHFKAPLPRFCSYSNLCSQLVWSCIDKVKIGEDVLMMLCVHTFIVLIIADEQMFL